MESDRDGDDMAGCWNDVGLERKDCSTVEGGRFRETKE